MPLPPIAEAEWAVMTVLWDSKDPLNGQEIIAAIPEGEYSKDPGAIKSHVQRLLKKGAIKAERRGRAYYYSPAIDQKEALDREAEKLLEKVPEGAGGFLVSRFLSELQLSEEDLEELREEL